MRLLKKLKEKTLPYISLFSLIINILQPFALVGFLGLNPSPAHASEATGSAEITEPTPEPTIIVEPTATPSPSPEPGQDPIIETEEIITEEPKNALPEPDLEQSPEGTSAQTPASVVTDKADYAPTDTVLITANDLSPSTIYTLRITSLDPPPVNFETEVSSDADGILFYAYQLDGTYRPDYLVEISLGELPVASTTFTDNNSIGNCLEVPEEQKDGPDGGFLLTAPDGYVVSGLAIKAGSTCFPSVGNAYTSDETYENSYDDGNTRPNSCYQVSGVGTKTASAERVGQGHKTICQEISHIEILIEEEEGDPASITIVKNAVPDDSEDFEFTSPSVETFYLDDDVESTLSHQKVFTTQDVLQVGETYTFTESEVPGWILSSNIPCTGANEQQITVDNRSVTINELQDEQDIVCTFTNTLVTGFLQGRKYNDDNMNGVMEQGEAFLGDWVINLYDSQWNYLEQRFTGHTGNTGQYRFDDLAPGTYNTCEVLQDGWLQTGPNIGDYPVNYSGHPPYGDIAIAVPNLSNNPNEGGVCWQIDTIGEDIGGLGFGNIQAGTIRTEKITLPPDSDTEFEFSASYYDSSFYLKNGQYNESDVLLPGFYSVGEEVPDGWKLTDAICTDGETDFDPRGDEFELLSDQNLTCTFTNTEYSSISGYKYEDNDGVLGGTTTTIPLWDIELWLGDSKVGETSTDSLGYYSFTKLLPGNYLVKEIMQSGWTNIVGTPTILDVELEAGEVSEDNDFTNTQLGSIQGRKYQDVNGNGDFDQVEKDEAGNPNRLDDWNIALYDTNWNVVLDPDSNQQIMLTGDDTTPAGNVGKGQYRFVNVYPDTYYVCETPQSNWIQTEPVSGPQTEEGTHCHTVTVNSGQAVTGIQFGNFHEGYISGHKWNDLDGDGIWDTGEPVLKGWKIRLDRPVGKDRTSTTNSSGYYYFGDLGPGDYTVYEENQPGWIQTAPDGDVFDISMTSNGAYSDKDFGNRGDLDLTVCKYEDDNGLIRGGNFTPLSGWEFVLGAEGDSQYTEEDGCTTFEHLTPGRYTVYEQFPEDEEWFSADSTEGIQSVELIEEDLTINFYNYQLGNIYGHKWNDLNGNSERDCLSQDQDLLLNLFRDEGCELEPLLSDWIIFVDENSNKQLDEKEQFTTTNKFGEYSFENFEPGTYTICEIQQERWTQTYPLGEGNEVVCHQITINSGDFERNINFGNQADPVLTIEKSNDASGTKSPGDTVEFTITVELTGSDLNGVEVTDLPATGFTYQSGSWTANSSVRGDISGLGEPTYSSPGTWILGNMVAGEIVTLTYLADISTDQDRGLYKDIAWAQGTKSFEFAPEPTVLAIGQNSDYVDGNFVGTEVEIDFYESETTNVNIEKEGDVLGASTELPATGASTGWTFLALALMALGGLFMTLGGKMQKGMIKMLAIIFAVTLISNVASTTYAAVDVDSTLSVRVEQPKSPTRLDDWSLAFTVLDLDGDVPTVNCYVKKPSASSFILFNSPQILDAGGNNGSCHVTSNEIGEEGTYEFYITADSGGGVEATDIVSVEYSNSGPAAPENYSKDHPSSCRWVIKFKTANDGKTVNVEIYSSTSTSFSADGGTRVGSISIGPDQDGEFIHDRAGQCDQEWFYVIRAFDSIGNGSGLVGDSVVISPTVVEETTTDETVQAIPVSESILGLQDVEQEDATDTGDILGEVAEEEGSGLISSAKDAIETATKGKNIWWTIFAILVAGLVSYGFYTRYKAKENN